MTTRFICLLLLVCHLGYAYREFSPKGIKEFHSIKEGHDLILRCPLTPREDGKLTRIMWAGNRMEIFSMDGKDLFEAGNVLY